MSIEVVEVLGRAKQGITKPFLCKTDDGALYYVKGKGAGRKSLIAEYVCGSLAKSFGLPIADFEMVYVSEQLIDMANDEAKSDLGIGVAFASKVTPHLQEISKSQVDKVALNLRRDLLIFDWWILNADRTLSDYGGNPNLLWDSDTKQLQVIDHNQAFDTEFNGLDFCHTHIFGGHLPDVFDDMFARQAYVDRLAILFGGLDAVCDNIPHSWWWVDHGVPADLNPDSIKQVLSRFSEDNFWRIV